MVVVEAPAEKQIWAGTVNGRLCVLAGDGQLIRRDQLPIYIAHLALDTRSQMILATTAERHLACYAAL